jgi:hypothetical protein
MIAGHDRVLARFSVTWHEGIDKYFRESAQGEACCCG